MFNRLTQALTTLTQINNRYSRLPDNKTSWQDKIVECKTTMNRGKSIQFWLPNGKTKTSKPSNLKLLYHANHWKIDIIEHQ